MNKASGIPVELFQILKDNAVKLLHSICQQIWKTQQWPQDWKSSVFILIPKKGNVKECSNYPITAGWATHKLRKIITKNGKYNASKFGKFSSGHRTGKAQFSFQSQRKAMPKNAQTTTQLHSSHMLVK